MMAMSEAPLFNRHFERAVVALRRGEEGEAGLALEGVAKFLITNVQLTQRYMAMDTSIVGFVQRFAEAQARGDWIRLADMLAFELPGMDCVQSFIYPGLRLETDTGNTVRIGQPVRFAVRKRESTIAAVAEQARDVAYAFRLQYLGDRPGSDYARETEVRAFAETPEWQWTPTGPPGLYRVKIWLKRKKILARSRLFDVEDVLYLTVNE